MVRTNDVSVRLAAMSRQLGVEQAARLKAQAEVGGLKSANRRLRMMVLQTRAEVAKLRAEQEKPDASG
jgi:hypothetical protein